MGRKPRVKKRTLVCSRPRSIRLTPQQPVRFPQDPFTVSNITEQEPEPELGQDLLDFNICLDAEDDQDELHISSAEPDDDDNDNTLDMSDWEDD